jgi:phospholipid/cholesterol/gamma-HCH transport system substrate-binding protein/paraquat-inducible protein B
MPQETNYFKIGLFVIISSALFVAAILFFGAAKYFEPKIYVESYFNESVQGLDIGSPVKYRGITIGHVSQITMISNVYTMNDIKNAEIYNRYIYIKMALIKNKVQHFEGNTAGSGLEELIHSGLRVRLVSQGFTGTSYLEMTFLNPKDNPTQKITWKTTDLYLPSAASTLARFTDAIETILDGLQKVNYKKVFDDVDTLTLSMNTAINSSNLPALSKDLSASLSTIRQVADSYKNVADKLNTLIDKDKIDGILNNIQTSSEKANQTFSLLSEAATHANQLMSESANKVINILDNTEVATDNIKTLSASMKENPSQLLWGTQPPALNPATIQ